MSSSFGYVAKGFALSGEICGFTQPFLCSNALGNHWVIFGPSATEHAEIWSSMQGSTKD
jgi:hypothetical protein